MTTTNGATINFSAFTSDLAFVGTYSISVTSTLIGYDFTPTRVAPTCSSAFQFTVLDPCLLTTITILPGSVENLVAFAGYNVSSLVKYTFNDTQS